MPVGENKFCSANAFWHAIVVYEMLDCCRRVSVIGKLEIHEKDPKTLGLTSQAGFKPTDRKSVV